VRAAIIHVNNSRYFQLEVIAEEKEKKSYIHACIPRKSFGTIIEKSQFRNHAGMVAAGSPTAMKWKILWKFRILKRFQKFFICIIFL